MKEIGIKTEFIQLQNVLKILNIIYSGGESKIYLIENDVLVNGEVERRRGRKLYPGDILQINNTNYLIKNENQ